MSYLFYANCLDCEWHGALDDKERHEQEHPDHLVTIIEEEVPCGCS